MFKLTKCYIKKKVSYYFLIERILCMEWHHVADILNSGAWILLFFAEITSGHTVGSRINWTNASSFLLSIYDSKISDAVWLLASKFLAYSNRLSFFSNSTGHFGTRMCSSDSISSLQSSHRPVLAGEKCRVKLPQRYRPLNIRATVTLLFTE